MLSRIHNSKGEVFYGLHFYPGVAEYQEAGGEPYRVFLNESTLRSMDQSFTGKPIFVEHVDDVEQNLDELRKEVDGWVYESFYNSSDGKHWVKFIVVSERGKRAVKSGMKLSNAYVPKSFREGGLWNGVSYAKEITEAEYEHLAIVDNPRYEESVIMTSEEFKKYNERHEIELKRIANSKGDSTMFKFFKKQRVENAIDPELLVTLPKSNKTRSVAQIINEADEKESDKNAGLADMSHKVKMADGSYCNVGELMDKYKAMNEEIEAFKKKKEDSAESELDVKAEETKVDVEGDKANDDDMDEMENERSEDNKENADDEDEDSKKKALQLAEEKEKEVEDAKKKKNAAAAKAEKLRNANVRPLNSQVAPNLEMSIDRVNRGKARYGS